MAQLILVLEELIVNTALPHIQRAASWMAGPLARRVRSGIPLYPIRRGGLRPVVLGCRMPPISSNAGFEGL
jgi:hypothetical protein